MLVEIGHRTGGTSTESTVPGPFHMVESPPRELGENIALDGKATPCLVSGQVTDPDGEPIPGAQVDVWQANAAGPARGAAHRGRGGHVRRGVLIQRPGS
ncbi:hypothetical protein ACQEVF_52345 [Nonomuraea polychroma]|uniref:dioxygenase family protein n=1 Tax=Nonomuraea polychroma TaxID=46176 RepID=UPI003D89F7EF